FKSEIAGKNASELSEWQQQVRAAVVSVNQKVLALAVLEEKRAQNLECVTLLDEIYRELHDGRPSEVLVDAKTAFSESACDTIDSLQTRIDALKLAELQVKESLQ